MLVQHVQFSVTLIHETPTHNQHSVLSLWSTRESSRHTLNVLARALTIDVYSRVKPE